MTTAIITANWKDEEIIEGSILEVADSFECEREAESGEYLVTFYEGFFTKEDQSKNPETIDGTYYAQGFYDYFDEFETSEALYDNQSKKLYFEKDEFKVGGETIKIFKEIKSVLEVYMDEKIGSYNDEEAHNLSGTTKDELIQECLHIFGLDIEQIEIKFY